MNPLSVLSRPRLPRSAVALSGHEVAAVELRRRGSRFVATNVAYEALAPGLCVPSFEQTNIPNPEALAEALDRVVSTAGLAKRQRWSVILPESAVRTFTLSLESVPGSREELRQVLDWKTERLTGARAADLSIGRQFIAAGRTPRFLIVAARKSVLGEYERLFAALDWTVGLLVPRFVGETAWLNWDAAPGDKLVLGARENRWTAAFVRGRDVLLVRPIEGNDSDLEDEIYRLALYYRDRVAETPERATVTRLMTCGPLDGERLAEVIGSALGTAPAVVDVVPGMLEVDVPPGSLATVTAAAGLAAQAWAP